VRATRAFVRIGLAVLVLRIAKVPATYETIVALMVGWGFAVAYFKMEMEPQR
jgi:hypothetical protein